MYAQTSQNIFYPTPDRPVIYNSISEKKSKTAIKQCIIFVPVGLLEYLQKNLKNYVIKIAKIIQIIFINDILMINTTYN